MGVHASVERPALRCLGIVSPTPTAVSYVRFFQPFEALGDRARLVTLGENLRLRRRDGRWQPESSLLDGIDAVLFPQNIAAPTLADGSRLELVEPICREARERGLPVVYSVDDHLAAPDPLNPITDELERSDVNLKALLEGADAVIATTWRLAEAVRVGRRPSFVLPNCIDRSRWRARPRAGGELRIGWAGSSSHLPDLEMVLPALLRLREKTEFTLVIYGLTDRPLSRQLHEIRQGRRRLGSGQRDRAEAFERIAATLRELGAEHHPFESIERFPARLAALDLDIGLCPLVESPFSACKSALKFYEYAACGTLTLASAVAPYSDELALTVPNETDAWCGELERLARDPDSRTRELEVQRGFVLTERDIRAHVGAWSDALDRIGTLSQRIEVSP